MDCFDDVEGSVVTEGAVVFVHVEEGADYCYYVYWVGRIRDVFERKEEEK